METFELSTLSEDLKSLFEKTDITRLCYDHAEPFILDGRHPVLDITRDTLIGIFSGNYSSRTFLSPQQILSIINFLEAKKPGKIPVKAKVALLLKSQWELYFGQVVSVCTGTEVNITGKFKDRSSIELYGKNWKPDFRVIETGLTPQRSGKINLLISEFVRTFSFLMPVGDFLQGNSKTIPTEAVLLFKAEAEIAERYNASKIIWVDKLAVLDNLLYKIDQIKTMGRNWCRKYYDQFATQLSEIAELIYQNETKEILLRLSKENPVLSYEELEEEAQQFLFEAKKMREVVAENIFKSRNYWKVPDNYQSHSQGMNEQIFQDYQKTYKSLKRKTYFLLHHDQIPGFNLLSDDIKTKIKDLLTELQAFIEMDEYRYQPNNFFYNHPDLVKLKDIYLRACLIRNVEPDLDFDDNSRLDFLISQGYSIEQLIELMEKESSEISEIHLPGLELEKRAQLSDPQTNFYKEALDDIALHEDYLKNKAEQLRTEIESLNQQIEMQLNTIVI